MSIKKAAERKLLEAFNAALAAEDHVLAAALLIVLTIFLSGKRDLLGGLAVRGRA